ncbi:MAG: IS1595 family transposase [Candidatus Latescibacterota bacterium]
MEDYPHTLRELELRFATDEACRRYLATLRWPEGFVCGACGGHRAWPTGRGLWMCCGCGQQVSVTAGTIFQDTRTPLPLWFRAIWWVVSQKNGASAQGLQRILGLGSYSTAWTWLHKLRRAMVRPGREPLSGSVEVDETLVGGAEPGGGRRHLGEKKALVVIAAEVRGRAIGRIRMQRVASGAAADVMPFLQAVIAPGSVVITDGLQTYVGLPEKGYQHDRRVVLGSGASAEAVLPRGHRVASLLKRWLLGTHQGAVSREHLDYYLDEFCVRFNRRTSSHRGKLFYRLLQQAVAVEPVPYRALVKGIRGRRKATDHKK